MSHLSTEKSSRLTVAINARLDEFGQQVFDHLPPGVVRIAQDEVERLWEEEDAEIVEDYANARQQAYEKGFELGFQTGIGNPATLGAFLYKLRNGRGLGIRRAALAAGVAPKDVIAMERDISDDPLLIGNLVRAYFTDYPAVDGLDHDDDGEDVDPGPDFDGGFYTQTPDGHTIHVNGDPNMDEATADAIREMADKAVEFLDKREKEATESEPPKIDGKLTDAEPWTDADQAAWHDELVVEGIDPNTGEPAQDDAASDPQKTVEKSISDGQALVDAFASIDMTRPDWQPSNGHHAEPEPAPDDPLPDDPPPASAAAIYKREPTAAEIAHGRALETSATLGPEDVVVTPVRKPIGPARNPARAAVAEAIIADAPDFDLTPKPSLGNATGVTSEHKAAHKQAKLERIIAAMKGMAVDGRMLPLRQWDDHRPAGLPNWQSISMQYDINSWGEMADLCGLEYTGRRLSRPQVRAGKEQAARAGNKGNYLPTLEELIAEVQRQSMAGVMPSLAQFDQAKPANWATAGSHLSRFNINWEQLANEAGLKFRGKNGNA